MGKILTVQNTKDISPLHWCEDILLKAAAHSFFGDALLDENPNHLDDFPNLQRRILEADVPISQIPFSRHALSQRRPYQSSREIL
jgi:hypothetical protein